MEKNSIEVDEILNCARCGRDHRNLNFKKFIVPIEEYTYWSTCPETGDPILMKLNEDYGKE